MSLGAPKSTVNGFSCSASAGMSVRLGGNPDPSDQVICESVLFQNLMNSLAASAVASSDWPLPAKATLVPGVTGPAGPAGGGATPKLSPASEKPVVIHGPTISIAARPVWNRLSASAPASPIGEIPSSMTRPPQKSSASIVSGASSSDVVPSSETTPPPLPHSRIGHIGTVLLSARARPYWPSPVSFTAASANSSHVAGGVSGSRPAASKRSLFQ